MLTCLLALTPAVLPPAPQAEFAETRRLLPQIDMSSISVPDAAAGDLDGDGDLDVVLGRSDGFGTGAASDVLWFNSGAGRFEDKSANLPAGDLTTLTVELVDLDGDGDLDLYRGFTAISTPFGSGEILANDGAGLFTVGLGTTGPSGDNVDVEAADIDLDGDLDLVGVFAEQPLTVLRNNGAGLSFGIELDAFPAQPGDGSDVALGDLDQDGAVDAVFSWGDGQEVYANSGAGAFSTLSSLPFLARAADLADVDGDGDNDLYVSGVDRDALLLNDGTGGLTESPSPLPASTQTGWTAGGVFADVDGDSAPDVLSVGGPHPWHILVLANETPGVFTDATADVTPFTPYIDNILVFDADGDQDPDVMTFLFTNAPHLWLSDGERFLDAQAQPGGYRAAYGPSTARGILGDVNGDGLPDLLSNVGIGAPFGGSIPPQSAALIHLNTGPAVFTESPIEFKLQPYLDAHDLLLNDFDVDGDLDVVLGLERADLVYLNDGLGAFAELPNAIPAVDIFTWGLAAADLNGDAAPDIVVCRTAGIFSPALVEVIEGDGTGHFTPMPDAVMPANGAFPTVFLDIDLVDVDADGDLDLFLGSTKTSEVHRNDGAADFTWIGSYGEGFADFGDIDSDGDADFVLSDAFEPHKVFLGDGGGGFSQSAVLFVGDEGNNPHLVDYDDDGDLDLFAGYPTVELYRGDGAGGFTHAPGAVDLIGSLATVGDLNGDGKVDLVLAEQRQLAVATGVRGGHVAWRTPPRVGKEQTIEVFGAAGDPVVLAASTATADIAPPPFGTLLLDPATLFVVEPGGVIPADGVYSFEAPVPDQPSLLGATLWWQALVGGSLQLTNADPTTFTGF